MTTGLDFQPGRWITPNLGRAQVVPRGVLFSDGSGPGFHVLALPAGASYRRVRVRACIEFSPEGSADFCIHLYGGYKVAVISRRGEVAYLLPAASLSVRQRSATSWAFDLVFDSPHDLILFGTSRGIDVFYDGEGAPQFLLTEFAADVDAERANRESKLVLVDVGAASGLQPAWIGRAPELRPVLFEPDPVAAAALREQMRHLADTLVVETALSDTDGPATLYLTKFRQCSSLLRPNWARLRDYSVSPCFEVDRSVVVQCRRYDSLYQEGVVPAPDVIKIDVQGLELNVLKGFGKLLEQCVAIEAECHFYALYEGEPLIGDIIHFLDRFGFVLRRLDPQANFDGDLVEVNAFFTRRGIDPDTQPEAARKLRLAEEAFDTVRPPRTVHPLTRLLATE